uniref:Uncharacterized protein n=2 Tax=Odontella aurita TaxID=265563 RepID=A0A7S4NCU4_9STRA|mmetsp:Transcript_58390/g.173983  ORF Transcript_58390/g.173983 Transcript_58390/m.173983 type:complete len:143 (+) Transcript_58390:56-484(+)
MWNALHAAMERSSCRKNGFVILFDRTKALSSSNRAKFHSFAQLIVSLVNCVPLSFRAVHYVFGPNHSWRDIILSWELRVLGGIFGILMKQKTVVHVESFEDLVLNLGVAYGISSNNIPATLGGSLDSEYCGQWLTSRRGINT